MAENESLGNKLRGVWQKFKYDITGNPKYLKPKQPKHRVRIVPPSHPRVRVTSEQMPPDHSLVNPIENVHSADTFIEAIRNPRYYQPLNTPSGTILRSNELGLEIDPRNGFFFANSVLRAALVRYSLPLALYMRDDHARLVVESPKFDIRSEITRIPVYDPMLGAITQIEHPQSIPLNSRLWPNALAESQLQSEMYDLTYLNDPSLGRYRDSFLLAGKFSALQRDGKNCILYCLFVGAMLEALKPGDTKFKKNGIPQFQRDFGVRILTREEITGVRIE